MFEQFAREAVDMEAHDAADVLAQDCRGLPAGRADAAGQRAVHHDLLAGREAGDAVADCGDLAGGFRATTSGILRLAKAMPR